MPVEAFNFREDVDGADHSKYLWSNAAYTLGARLTDAFAKYGWTVAIRGVEGGGLVEGLPTHTFATDEGDVALKCPTEIAITDRREKELSDLGFIPLVHCKGTDYAAFFGTQSCQKAKKYDTDAANANARLSTQLQYILATSRFAHYLKVIMRDKIGSFMTRADVEYFMNRWINNYVVDPKNVGQAEKARRPLSEARVDVREIPGKPGLSRCGVSQTAFPARRADGVVAPGGRTATSRQWLKCRPLVTHPTGTLAEEGGASQGHGSAVSARIKEAGKFFSERKEKTDGR